MNDEMERGSLDLEEIIKEFSDHSQEPEQEALAEEEAVEETAEEAAEEDLEQTRRIDQAEIQKVNDIPQQYAVDEISDGTGDD